MPHSVTARLNRDARTHDNASGTTFFVDLGERNFNYKTKENEYTNYSAALFANDKQKQFYADSLVKGAVIEVSGTGIIIDMPDDPQYSPRLAIQDAKLGFIATPDGPSEPRQAAPAQQAAPKPAPIDDFDDSVPF